MTFRNKKILIISFDCWGKMHVSKHHYAIELARRENDVFFLNPPDRRGPFFRKEHLPEYGRLYVISYNPIFCAKRYLPKSFFSLLLKIQAVILLKLADMEPDVVWSFWAFPFIDLSVFGAKLNIYFAADRLPQKEHLEVVKSAGIIFSTSEEALTDFKSYGKPGFLVNHGLADELVRNAEAALLRHDYRSSQGKIMVGFVGNLLKGFIDTEIVMRIVRENKDAHYLFIGPHARSQTNLGAFLHRSTEDFVAFLKQQQNVTLVGPLSLEDMMPLFDRIDCFLIVERDEEFNKGYNPHKLLEHLSLGKVVISHHLSLYKNARDLIQMPDNRSNESLPVLFKKTINNLSSFNSPELQEKRIRFALDNSYEKQIQRIEEFVNKNGVGDRFEE